MTKRWTLIVFVVLLALSGWSLVRYFQLRSELGTLKQAVGARQLNTKVVNFATLFVDKVLKVEGEVDFETRLELENAVRGLDEPEILAQWRTFVESESEAAAQRAVRDLLSLLLSKLKTD